MKNIFSVVVVCLSVFLPVEVFAGGSVAGATEITQIANNVELAAQTLTEAEQLATQLLQYQDMVKNTLNVPNQVWSNVQGDLVKLMSVVQKGEGLAFSMGNIGEQFESKFPGYKPSSNFPTDYKKWSQTFRDTLKGSLEAANLQSQQFASEEAVLSQLRSMSSSSQGRLQAIQVGNQIAGETAAQLQKLRALTLAQYQSQAAYMAQEQQQKDTQQAGIDQILKKGSVKSGKSYKNF